MALRVAINGFGRIGRTFLRTALQDPQTAGKLEFVAINEGPCPSGFVDHLFKYDSVLPSYAGDVTLHGDTLSVNGQSIKLFSKACPDTLPWKDLGIDWVVEASGCFTTHERASMHLEAGAKNVLITAPSKDPDVTIIPGVNDESYNTNDHHIISLGSCTTNCFAPMVKVVKENFGFEQGLMTTIHSYTNTQVLLDTQHKDPRRARAAAVNIIPTNTGADKVIVQIFPELKGKLEAIAIRVPVPVVSLVDFTFVTKETLTIEQINNTFKQQAIGPLKNILHYCTQPLVSSDFIGTPYSLAFDSLITKSTGTQHKIFAWYDNEYGYSSRIKDFLLHNS